MIETILERHEPGYERAPHEEDRAPQPPRRLKDAARVPALAAPYLADMDERRPCAYAAVETLVEPE